jgi:hypothetical protein
VVPELGGERPWRAAAVPVELPAARSGARLVVPDVLLIDLLAVLAAARTRADAATACLPLLAQRPGVRGVAVVVRAGRHVVVLGSAGYACGTMDVGAELPLDAGLPVTQAVRTGRTTVQGTGPAWVAVPFGGGAQQTGALLLSLTCGPPEATADLARLHRLARSLGDALHRAQQGDRLAAQLDVVTSVLTPTADADCGCQVVSRSAPAQDGVGGDVVIGLPDGRGGSWLVAADVVGSGLAAALLARSVRAALRTVAPWAPGPAALLDALERGIADDVPPGCFVTAVAVHLAPDGRVRVASAGHPAPLVLQAGQARELAVEPGPPLALEAASCREWVESGDVLPAGAALLLHTDGLTERRTADGVRLLDPVLLARGLPDDLELAADRVLAAADAVGPADDDVSVLLARRLA